MVRKANRDPIYTTDLRRFELALLITIPSVCLSSERKTAIDDYRHLPQSQTMSLTLLIIMYCICLDYYNEHAMHMTGSRRQIARVFAMPSMMPLPRIGVVELTNAPYDIPNTCRSPAQALLRILLLLLLSSLPLDTST